MPILPSLRTPMTVCQKFKSGIVDFSLALPINSVGSFINEMNAIEGIFLIFTRGPIASSSNTDHDGARIA